MPIQKKEKDTQFFKSIIILFYIFLSLKMIYRQILTEDITYAAMHHIEDKLWRYICYANIEQVRSKLRKVVI